MNKLLTKAAKLLLGLSLAAGVGVAIGSKAAEKANATVGSDVTIGNGIYESAYETGFESATASTTYNSTKEYTSGDCNGTSWSVYYGTVATNAYITGSKSMHMRWYSSATSNYPHAETTSSVADVKAFKFNYAVGNANVDFKVQYGTDGSNWTDIETVNTTGTGTTAYSHEFTTAISTFYFRVLVCLGTAPSSGNYTFRIDDVVFAKAKSADAVTLTVSPSSVHLIESGTQVLSANTQNGSGDVTWQTSNASIVSLNNNSGNSVTITGESVGVATITASYSTADDFTVSVLVTEHSGNQADPYSVSDAKFAIDANIGVSDIYVSGFISQIDSYLSNYNSITYWISDDGTTTDQFEVYSGKGLNNTNFTSETDILVGAEVVVYGSIKKFNGVYEFNMNSYLVSYTAPSNPLVTLDKNTVSLCTADTNGVVVTATVLNVDTPTYSWTTNDSNITLENISTNAVTIKPNTNTVGSATVNLSVGGVTPALTTSVSVSISLPLSVADALAASAQNNVFVAGVVSSITEVSTSHGNATYNISADGSTTTEMVVYRGKYLNNADFTSEDQIQVEDEVVIFGNLSSYNNAMQLATGNYLVSLNRPIKYAVSFNSNGGSESPAQINAKASTTFVFPSAGTKAGFLFAGWSSDNGTTKYAAGTTSPAVSGPITYVAYWDVDPIETIILSQGTFKTAYTSSDSSWDWENLVVTYETESGATGTSTDLTVSNFTFDPDSPCNVSSVDVYATIDGVDSNTLTINITYTLGASVDTFTAISGDLIENIVRYEAAKGGAQTAPAVNGGEIRVYQGGGTFTVSAYSGYKLTSVTIGSSMATTVTVSIDGGTASADQSISANGTKEVNNISASSVLFTCTGGDKNSRLYVNYLAVTYAVDATPILEVSCGSSLNLTTASGTTEYTISHLNISNDAQVSVSYSKNGVISASVENWQLSITVVSLTADSTNLTLSAGGASCTIAVSIIEADEYVKITDIDNLYQGQNVVIGSLNGSKALGTQNTNNRSAVDTTYSGSTIYIGDGASATILTVGIQEETDGTVHYSFYDSTSGNAGYLRAGYTNAKNYLTLTDDTSNAGALFTVSISDSGEATITSNSVTDDARNIIRYNSSDGLFSGYAGGQNGVAIYGFFGNVTDSQVVESFVVRHMKMNSISTSNTGVTENCSSNWSDANSAYAKLSSSQKTLFATDSAYANAALRFKYWAEANGKTFNTSTGVVSETNSVSLLATIVDKNTNTIAAIVIISLVSVTAIGGYFFIKRREEN